MSNDEFACIDPMEWCLSEDMGRKRRALLLDGVPYLQIIAKVAREARVVEIIRNKSKDYPGYFRAVLTIRVTSETCAMFHSSCCGYRAQYYQSVALGERANALAVKKLIQAVDSQLIDRRRMSRSWIHESLSGVTTKTWIHQGLWLRYCRRADRKLHVPRWSEKLQSADPKEKKRAMWASLLPNEENRIDLKGTFLTPEGQPLGINLKESRGTQIHDVGFT